MSPVLRRSATAVSLLLIAMIWHAPSANAADDGNLNTFDVRETRVNVIGDRCGTLHYEVDGWAAGYDADNTMGSAFVTVTGAGIDEIEMYDWWDWSLDDWDYLTWTGEQKICSRTDASVTVRAEFDVFPDTDLYDYDDGYSTALDETVVVDYQPVSVKTSNRAGVVQIQVRKDGMTWRGVPVWLDGLKGRTNNKGVATFSKRNLPKRQVKVTVGAAPAFATTKVRVR